MGSKRKVLRIMLAAFTTVTMVMLLLPFTLSPASASTVGPQTVTGNSTCGDFAENGSEIKIEGPSDLTSKDSGTYTDGTLVVELEIYETGMGPAFDWSSNLGVDVVVVKGGPAANVYRYTPAATGDTELHSPLNKNSGEWYGLSHVSFCYLQANETTADAAVDTTTTTLAPRATSESPTTSPGPSTTGAEVLPTQVIASTTTSQPAAEVSNVQQLPFTGLPAGWGLALGLSFLGAGITALALTRETQKD